MSAAIKNMISSAASAAGISSSLAIAVATVESSLNPNTPPSSAGAIGLFQLEPATACGLGVDPNNVCQNIYGGVTYLSQLLDTFNNNSQAALAAYNWGPENVTAAMAKYGPSWFSYIPASVQAYVNKVLSLT